MIFQLEKVDQFHKTFKIGAAPKTPCLIDEKEYLLRYNLMTEEKREYLEACKNGDIVEIADALGDQLYVLFGTILKHGLHDDMFSIFDEIHRSNMSKLDENGKPILRKDGKILKGQNYFKPNIKRILKP